MVFALAVMCVCVHAYVSVTGVIFIEVCAIMSKYYIFQSDKSDNDI